MSFYIVNGFVTDMRTMEEFERDMERERMKSEEPREQSRPRTKPTAFQPSGKRPSRPVGRRHK